LEPLDSADAVELLLRAGGRDRAGADPHTAAGMAALLGHLPLALVVAGARVRAYPDWGLADHLDRLRHNAARFHLDDGVTLALDASYQALPTQLQRLFRLLALHPGADFEPFAVAALAGTDPPTARGDLSLLATGHLLQCHGPDRYRFHDLVQVYAVNRAHDDEAGTAQRSAIDRLLAHYARAASSAMDQYAPLERDRRPPHSPVDVLPLPELSDKAAATRWLEDERTNLILSAVHAANHCADDNRAAHAGHQSGALWRYLDSAGHHQDALTLHRAALHAATATGDDAAQGRAHQLIGLATWRLGHTDQAIDHYGRALAIHRATRNRGAEGHTLNNMALVYAGTGELGEALRHQRQGLAAFQETGNRLAACAALGNLASTYWRLGQYEDALRQQLDILELWRELGDRQGEGDTLHNLGLTYLELGRYQDALHRASQALLIASESGNRTSEAFVLTGLSEICRRLGKHTEAAEYGGRALALARETSQPVIEIERSRPSATHTGT
jgi:tetratricopeptide (TPR) repeat protein